MDAVHDIVTAAIKSELASANAKFPGFNSPHEGYAVIREKMDETSEALIDSQIQLDRAWSKIKDNSIAMDEMQVLQEKMAHTAVEAIQTAAMAQKYIEAQMRGFVPDPKSVADAHVAMRQMENYMNATGDIIVAHTSTEETIGLSLQSECHKESK